MWASPGTDVGESWHGCGRVLARMWASPGARLRLPWSGPARLAGQKACRVLHVMHGLLFSVPEGRYKALRFTVDESATLHGFAGYFDAKLYALHRTHTRAVARCIAHTYTRCTP